MKLASCWPFPPWREQRLPGHQSQCHQEQSRHLKRKQQKTKQLVVCRLQTQVVNWLKQTRERDRNFSLPLAIHSGNPELCHHVDRCALGIGETVGRSISLAVWGRMPASCLPEAVPARVCCNHCYDASFQAATGKAL